MNRTPISYSAPIILVERLTDFLGLLMIAFAGAYAIQLDYGRTILILMTVFFVGLLLLLSSQRASLVLIRLVERLPIIGKFAAKVEQAYQSSALLVKPKALAIGIGLGLIAWFCECFGLFLVLEGFDVHFRIMSAAFIYAFATVVGALTFLPGGLGATEASMTGLLVFAKIPKHTAVATTFIIRAATLWFAVVVGAVALMFYQKRFSAKVAEFNLNNMLSETK
jgi:uncharacterized protein (TIRG00374 family)